MKYLLDTNICIFLINCRPIQMDLMIAAHALALDVTVVTNDTAEFGRVPGLRIEDWVAPM